VTRPPLYSRLRQLTDGIEFLYDRYVLGFSQGDQIELIRAVRDAAAALGVVARDAARRLRDALRAAAGTAGRTALAAAAASALLALLLVAGFRLLRRSRRLPPAAAAYRRLQRILRRRGAPLTAAAAPGETLEAARRFGQKAGRVAAEIITAYARESFGGAPPGAGVAERLATWLKQFREDLRGDRS
jgi:hypothetical protein